MMEVFSWRSPRSFSSWINFLPESQCCRHGTIIPQCAMHSNRIKITYTKGKKNKKHQIILPWGRIGFSSLDVSDNDEPKYQIRDPYELTNAVLSTNEQYNDCFLIHSTIPSQSHDEFSQTVYSNENSILEQPNSIRHCIFADAQLVKGFAQFSSKRVPQLRRTCRQANFLKDQVFLFWDSSSRRYIYNVVTKEKYSDKPDLQTLTTTLQKMQAHATMHGVSTRAIPKNWMWTWSDELTGCSQTPLK